MSRRACYMPIAEWSEIGRRNKNRYNEHKIAARLILRFALSLLTGTRPPKFWKFCRMGNGKLRIMNLDNLHCSISYSKKVNVVAVSNIGDIGVDIEYCGSDVSEEMMRAYLSHNEFADISKDSELCKRDKFIKLWTTKEALLKLCGQPDIDNMAHIDIGRHRGERFSFEYLDKRATIFVSRISDSYSSEPSWLSLAIDASQNAGAPLRKLEVYELLAA